MATVLELAREVRLRLISRDTGCLNVEFPDQTVALYFWDGTVATEREIFLSCFARNPSDFQFKSMEIRDSKEARHGASLLIEAIEGIDPKFLVRVWEPYAEWRISFHADPEIHNTRVKDHLSNAVEHLRRLMRLTVSGSMILEPPKTSIIDEISQIDEAFESGRWHEVLGVNHTSSESDLKQAYRKLARRFHPDRWATCPDMQLRDKIERTFQSVSRAYSELQRPSTTAILYLEGPVARKAFWQRMFGFVRIR